MNTNPQSVAGVDPAEEAARRRAVVAALKQTLDKWRDGEDYPEVSEEWHGGELLTPAGHVECDLYLMANGAGWHLEVKFWPRKGS